MIHTVTQELLGSVKNNLLRQYAQCYVEINNDFIDSVSQFGLQIATGNEDLIGAAYNNRVDALVNKGLIVENGSKSLRTGWISSACVACRLGAETETFLSSTQCPRKCYFCFNPNQVDYEYYLTHVHDMAAELQDRYEHGKHYNFLAVTGGEPLLHLDETIAFFYCAKKLYPNVHTRLYTSGWQLDSEKIQMLSDTGLDEIRFSIKLDESQASVDSVLDTIGSCVGVIPATMVEMPVMPDKTEEMKHLLKRLDLLGIQGINLLELCFPLTNAKAFSQRGYKIKRMPLRVPYDYWYAGGLPIAGSEKACLDLLEYALDENMRMGVHYCSLENKLTGQIYLQNLSIKSDSYYEKSQTDRFLKSVKVFGRDAVLAKNIFEQAGIHRMRFDQENEYLEFSPLDIMLLKDRLPYIELLVCTSIQEKRKDGFVVRELGVSLTTASEFDPADL
ncbi:MAG: radical SAM protein [Coriobacteriales bacterium]|nr:radical SAM protein [Coriobacteriales bacterium]